MSLRAVGAVAACAWLISGCSTTPAAPLQWHDLSGLNRGSAELEPDIAVCSAVYNEAFERAKGDIPANPTPGSSGSAMATEAVAAVNVWRSIANDAFNNCMRSNRWQHSRG
jgi:hypothetical protein